MPIHAQVVSGNVKPVAFANTYKFTDKDGIRSYNYYPIYTGPSGRRYSRPNGMEGTFILGNNWVRELAQLDSMSHDERTFYEMPQQAAGPVTAWVGTRKYIFLLKGDSLHQVFNVPDVPNISRYNIFSSPTGFYYFITPHDNKNPIFHFSFKTHTIDTIASWQLPSGNSHINFLKDTAGLPYLIAVYENATLLYAIQQPGQPTKLLRNIANRQDQIINILSAECFITARENFAGSTKLNLTWWFSGQPTPLVIDQSVDKVSGGYAITQLHDNIFQVLDIPTFKSKTITAQYVLTRDGMQSITKDPVLASYYICTPNKPLRVFPWIRQYPFLYGGTNSGATYALAQDSAGNIWAGSYNGTVSRIVKNMVEPVPYQVGRILNGGRWFKDKMYLIEEGRNGLASFTPTGYQKNISDSVTGYYVYVSPDQYFYYGTYDYQGLWRTPAGSLSGDKPAWERIDSSKGMRLQNILTITADTLGRIWCAHPVTGVAVYNPAKSRATTWLTDDSSNTVTALASLTDSMGTVWLGGKGSLWYYNNYDLPATPHNCRRIAHPLLANNHITALTVWQKDWLIIAAFDRILLLDLKAFYKDGSVNMRYLNPQEAAFTSFTEQNTMLTSHTDGSIWFSTSDNVYQWDVAQWMELPVFKTNPRILLHASGISDQILTAGKSYHLDAGLRTFQLEVALTSPDALPRYIRTALVRKGDSILWEEASLQSVFNFSNANAGHYQFLVEIFETDGTVHRLSYGLHLKPHFWQSIWFWVLVTGIAMAFALAIIYYNLKARTKKAELDALRSEQHKKLSDLRLLTMANQFRPHFILNALNTIGSRMNNDARTEKVLSSLGNSINIIFNNARRQGALHPFSEEWQLVLEVIQIHRLMYLPTLKTTLPDAQSLQLLSGMMVPLGLLQIPIENALLHGLGNVEEGPLELHISILEKEETFEIIMTDTGVGRAASARMSNATSHGTGTKNLETMLQILATSGAGTIEIIYEDDIYTSGINKNSKFGTRVLLSIPKTFVYG